MSNDRPNPVDPNVRDRAAQSMQSFVTGIDSTKIPVDGHTFWFKSPDLLVSLKVVPFNSRRRRPAATPPSPPGHPFQIISNPGIELVAGLPASLPASPSAGQSADLTSAELPSWLTDIERAVYEACTDKPQSTLEIKRRSGYSKSRVQDAISRMCCCKPPLLLRNAKGVQRFPRAGK